MALNQKIARRKRYPAERITDADSADNTALLANTLTQSESLLYRLQESPGKISVHINGDKIEYMFLNQEGNMLTLNGGSIKLEDKFTYLDGSVSSTKIDFYMRLVKAWTSIDRLSIIWKSHLSDKIRFPFQAVVVSILLYG